MQGKRLFIDANILVRAVLGIRVRELIERYCESVAFYVAESNVEEAMQYLAELAPRRGLREEVWRQSLAGIMAAAAVVTVDSPEEHQVLAHAQTFRRRDA